MTVYVLDTDLLSLYQRNHPQVCARIRLARHNGLTLQTTVVTVEEQYGGRLAQIRKAQTPETLVAAYDRLLATFALFSQLEILPYDLTDRQVFGLAPKIFALLRSLLLTAALLSPATAKISSE
jgi:tRNA(fMet)-specific endonuclease VapC